MHFHGYSMIGKHYSFTVYRVNILEYEVEIVKKLKCLLLLRIELEIESTISVRLDFLKCVRIFNSSNRKPRYTYLSIFSEMCLDLRF